MPYSLHGLKLNIINGVVKGVSHIMRSCVYSYEYLAVVIGKYLVAKNDYQIIVVIDKFQY